MSGLSRNQKVISVVAVLLTILILAGCYMFIIHPKKVELNKREAELKTEEVLLSQVQAKLNEKSTKTFESTVSLQKQIPVKPLLESLLLDIEKAEVLSESHVSDINIGEKGEVKEDESRTTQEDATADDAEESDDEKLPAVEPIPLPGGFQRVSVSLRVVSPGYYELEEFINTLESTERIVTVDNIRFSGNEEITTREKADEDESLDLNLTISAYYMPGLTELINQLPRIDAPQPGKKTNPLVTFPEL